jgi:hypothetical protein
MAGTSARPPTGGASPPNDGPELTHREAAEYIASLLAGLSQVANGAKMPFLAYLIDVALERPTMRRALATEGRLHALSETSCCP